MAHPVRVDSAGGEYMENVVVLEWAAEVGDAVKAGDLLVTIETAKAATEIAAPEDGYLTAIFAEIGAEVPLSALLGLIGATPEDRDFDAPDTASVAEPHQARSSKAAIPAPVAAPIAQTGRVIASPAARRQALMQGTDLRDVHASSPSGRIKLRDLVQQDKSAVSHSVLPPDDFGPLKVYRSGPIQGVPIVMIHGFGADAISWFPLERELSRRHPVMRIELPNHGQSPRRRTPSFAALSRDIVEAFDALFLEKAHIVGHSLGGACALALTDIRARKVASLTLLAPGGLGPVINSAFIDGLSRASRLESLGSWLRQMVGDPRMINDDFIAAALTARRDPEMRAAQQQMGRDLFPDGTQGFDLRAALSRLDVPTRILWGRADAILPWQQSLAAPGRVGLHLFEAIGHVPHLEISQDVLAILRAQIEISQVTT